jgi:DNA-binding SARP family transcriptional activator
MLRVQRFGTGQVRYEVQFLTGFPSQQCCLLLCYLLLNRHRPRHRERLSALFWGDYPTAALRKHLRNSVWRLRSVLQSLGTPRWSSKTITILLTAVHRALEIPPSFPQTLLASLRG